jgi:RNA polymerase sigma-70 factor (ECF subfamily)
VKSFLGRDQNLDGAVSSDRDFGAELARAAAGDPAAVRRLIVEFEPALTSFARRRGVPEVDSVVNAALSDAFRNLSTFRGVDRRAFRAYLFRILRCRIVDDQRSSMARSRSVVDLGDNGADELVDLTSSTFDDRVVDRQLVDDILGSLTDEQREVLEMRVLSGLSIRETADRTGRSEVAVKAMQRRALLSLRSLLVAVAALVVCGAVVAAVIASRESVTVLENAPIAEVPNGFDGRSDPVDPVGDNGSDPLIVDEADPVEAEQPRSEGEIGTEPELQAELDAPEGQEQQALLADSPVAEPRSPESAPADQPLESAGTSSDPADAEVDTADTAGSGAEPTATTSTPTTTAVPTPTTSSGAAGSATTVPATTVPAGVPQSSVAGSEPPFPIAPLPGSVTNTPCSVVTDGSPAIGEVAFVTYQLTGPYAMFDRTSIDIVGPGDRSALLPGSADPAEARDGDRFPFVIGGNMMWDKGFAVASTLAAGEVKTRCRIQEWAVGPPCVVTLDGPPATGDTARVKFRVPALYESLGQQQTFIRQWTKRSAMIGAETVPFTDNLRAEFAINGYMFKDGPFEVRTLFADGAAHAMCRVVEN